MNQMGISPSTTLGDIDTIKQSLSASTGVFDAVQEAIERDRVDFHLEKLGFARHVLNIGESTDTEARVILEARFAALFSKLTAMQRQAERDQEKDSISSRVNRERAMFLKDRLPTATKADVVMLLERIESVVDISIEGDALLAEIRRIRTDMTLDRDLSCPIEDKDALNIRLDRLVYAETLASQPDDRSPIAAATSGVGQVPVQSPTFPEIAGDSLRPEAAESISG